MQSFLIADANVERLNGLKYRLLFRVNAGK